MESLGLEKKQRNMLITEEWCRMKEAETEERRLAAQAEERRIAAEPKVEKMVGIGSEEALLISEW